MEPGEQRPRRRFSKRAVIYNVLLCWLLIGYATWTAQENIAITALGIIGSVIAAYMGVGHLDYRSVLNNIPYTSVSNGDETGQDTQ